MVDAIFFIFIETGLFVPRKRGIHAHSVQFRRFYFKILIRKPIGTLHLNRLVQDLNCCFSTVNGFCIKRCKLIFQEILLLPWFWLLDCRLFLNIIQFLLCFQNSDLFLQELDLFVRQLGLFQEVTLWQIHIWNGRSSKHGEFWKASLRCL